MLVRRLLPLALLAPLLTLAVSGPARADTVPGLGQPWPTCGEAPDTDGKYCILSITRDGIEVPPVDYNTPGVYDDPAVELIGSGDVRFGVQTTTVHDGSGPTSDLEVDPGHTWVFEVNTGSIKPNEMRGTVRDTDLNLGGGLPDGYTFKLTFKPAPIAWLAPENPISCSYNDGCGDDTTVADTGWVHDGFVDGQVTDDASSGLPAGEIADRHGYVQSYNAQDAYTFYDLDTNTLEVRMANPHLKEAGVPATGYYDTFLPNAYLIDQLAVPDPSSLTGGSFTVRRAGSSTSVPFTVTHEPGGVRIHISGITFSRPRYKIHPKPTTPGTPRHLRVRHVTRHSVKVSFKKPRADGGKPVTAYAARCRHGSKAWHDARRGRSPITVTHLPRGTVTCQVRAKNVKGWGHWSMPRHT